MPRVQNIKAKRAALVAKATAGLLLHGEIYSIKDDTPATLAMATSTTAFNEYYNKIQVDSKVGAVLPTQTGNSGKFLTTNGTATSWASANSGVKTIFTSKLNSGNTIDLSLGDNFYIDANGAGSLYLVGYDGKFKTLCVYNSSQSGAVSITVEMPFQSISKTVTSVGAVASSDGISASCNAAVFGVAGDFRSTFFVDLGNRYLHWTVAQTVAPITSATVASKNNISMRLELVGKSVDQLVVFVSQNTVAPSIDVGQISRDQLVASDNYSQAPTLQGAKMLMFKNVPSSILILGLISYTRYSFTIYQYRDAFASGIASGWSSPITLLNQRTTS